MRVVWSRRADILVVAVIVLLALSAVGALLYHGRRLEADQLQAHAQLAEMDARHNAHLFGQTLGAVDITLRTLLKLRSDAAAPPAQALQEALRNAPHLRSLSLLDRHGVVVASSNPANVGVRVALQGYLPQDDGGEAVLRIGPPQAGRDLADGQARAGALAGPDLGYVPVALGVAGPQGRGAVAVAVATLNVDFFLNQFMAHDARHWALDVLRYDGTLLVSTREADLPAWAQANQALARRWQEGREIGTLLQDIPGQQAWLTAWRSSHTRPFAVVTRIERSEALAGARTEARQMALVTLPLIVLATGALMGGYGLFRRATLRQLQSHAEQATHLARLLDALPAGVLLFGADGRVMAVNQAWRDMAADGPLPLQSLQEMHCSELCRHLQRDEDGEADGAGAARLDHGIAAVLDGRSEHHEGEFRAAGPAGVRWLRIGVRPFTREGQRCALLFQLDITAQRRNAEQLRLNGRVFAINAEAIVITDARNRIVSVNPAFTRITGYSAEEALGRTPALLASGRQDAAFYERMWASLTHQGSWEGEIVNRRKCGELFTERLTITVDCDAEGRPRHFVGVFQDITERKRAEDRLRLLGAALDAADNAVMITDAQAVIEWANPAFCRLSGYALEQALGCRPPALLAAPQQDPTVLKDLQQTVQAGRVWRGEVTNRRPGGQVYEAALTITPLADEHGAPRHFITLMEDISVRKRQELELHRLATTDPLTGALNRRAFLAEVEAELARFRRSGCMGALLMLDVDHFKRVNDRYGHPVGDVVLVALCHALHERLRRTDRLGRLGGEEFAVLLPETSPQAAVHAAEALRQAVAALRIESGTGPFSVTVSVGVAAFDAALDAGSAPLLSRADQALYQAKEQGRDRVVLAAAASAAA